MINFKRMIKGSAYLIKWVLLFFVLCISFLEIIKTEQYCFDYIGKIVACQNIACTITWFHPCKLWNWEEIMNYNEAEKNWLELG